MQVRIYDTDETGNEFYRAQCDHSECFPDTDEAYKALEYLRAQGRYWIGGGSAPLVLITRAE